MYRNSFGTKNQIRFDSAADYYEFLGYLAKGDGTTKIVWEHNDEQGAWAEEGRIQFYENPPATLKAKLNHTAGTGNVISRVNCNDFVEHIAQHHHFKSNAAQDQKAVRASIPVTHQSDFDRGLGL